MVKEETKRQLFLGRIVLSLVVATIIFVGIFSFGYFVAFENYQGVVEEQDFLLNSLLQLQIEKELVEESCAGLDVEKSSQKLYEMSTMMGEIEDKLGKTNPDVIEQKKMFSVLQIQHYLLIKENNENCEADIPVILFFYSNREGYIDKAEKMGYILSNYRINNPDVVVYSLDYDLDITLINTLKRIKGAEEPNSVVYEDRVLESLENIDDLKDFIDDEGEGREAGEETISLN